MINMKTKTIILILAAALVLTFTSCGLTVPRPEIKEGEFDLSVTYELNGEQKTLSAVYICEYDGVSWSIEGGDFSRDWADRTEGDYKGDDYSATIGKTEDGGDIILFFGVYPEYFMDDSTGDRGTPEPSLHISYPEDEDGGMRHVGDAQEIEREYGARIISYNYEKPIENSYGLLK